MYTSTHDRFGAAAGLAAAVAFAIFMTVLADMCAPEEGRPVPRTPTTEVTHVPST